MSEKMLSGEASRVRAKYRHSTSAGPPHPAQLAAEKDLMHPLHVRDLAFILEMARTHYLALRDRDLHPAGLVCRVSSRTE